MISMRLSICCIVCCAIMEDRKITVIHVQNRVLLTIINIHFLRFNMKRTSFENRRLSLCLSDYYQPCYHRLFHPLPAAVLEEGTRGECVPGSRHLLAAERDL